MDDRSIHTSMSDSYRCQRLFGRMLKELLGPVDRLPLAEDFFLSQGELLGLMASFGNMKFYAITPNK